MNGIGLALPEDKLASSGRNIGPVTQNRQRRTFLIYFSMVLLGIAPQILNAPAWLQVTAYGLWIPGGAFVALGGWWALLFPLTLILFCLSLVAWFWAGVVVLPIGVWLGSAALAGLFANDPVGLGTPLILAPVILGLIMGFQWKDRRRRQLGLELAKEREAYLSSALADVKTAATKKPAEYRELSFDQLSSVRYLLDRALQPIESFDGFTIIDQFQPAAIRYQLNHMGFALGAVQQNYVPNFHGYFALAQKNLIEKYLDKKVWGYWVLESCWGHLNFTNWDPADRDNIMLTGWFGAQVGLYMNATGDRHYLKPGSLTFRLNNRTAYRHDFTTITGSISDNYESAEFGHYACEPNWIYPVCNHYGMTTLQAHDIITGSNLVEKHLPNWLEKMDVEFTDASGSIVGLRSQLTGFAVHLPIGEAGYAHFENCFIPSRAQKLWAIAQREIEPFVKTDDDGMLRLELPGEGVDPGNYKPGHLGSYSAYLVAAREFGDERLAEAALRAMERECEPSEVGGVRRYLKGSNMSNAVAVLGMVLDTGDFRKLFNEPTAPEILSGPMIETLSYPDILVARAVSDGKDLHAIFYPGVTNGVQTIKIAQLDPGQLYHISGAQSEFVTADAKGNVSVAIHLEGRTEFMLKPA